jgi:hypothetical protein
MEVPVVPARKARTSALVESAMIASTAAQLIWKLGPIALSGRTVGVCAANAAAPTLGAATAGAQSVARIWNEELLDAIGAALPAGAEAYREECKAMRGASPVLPDADTRNAASAPGCDRSQAMDSTPGTAGRVPR